MTMHAAILYTVSGERWHLTITSKNDHAKMKISKNKKELYLVSKNPHNPQNSQ